MESENSTIWKTNNQVKKWAKDLNSLPNALACPSRCNKTPQTGWLQQQTFMICYFVVKYEENDGISCSNSTRMIKVLTHSVPGESSHSSLWPAASRLIIIWSFLSTSRVVVIVLSCSKSELLMGSCLTFCNLMNYRPLGSSVPGISQARILEWVAISSSRGSSQPRDQTRVSCIGRLILYYWATWKGPNWKLHEVNWITLL